MSKQTEALTNKISGKPENKLPETFTGKKSGEIQLLLDKYKGAIAQVIPTHLNAEKLIGLAVHTLSHNPELMSCSIQSVIGGVIQASIMDLNSIRHSAIATLSREITKKQASKKLFSNSDTKE